MARSYCSAFVFRDVDILARIGREFRVNRESNEVSADSRTCVAYSLNRCNGIIIITINII